MPDYFYFWAAVPSEMSRCIYRPYMKTKIGHAIDSSRMILNKMRPRVFKLFAGWYVNRSHPGGLLRDDITPTHSQTIIRFWALVTIMQTNFNYFAGGRMKTSFPPSFSICFFSWDKLGWMKGLFFFFNFKKEKLWVVQVQSGLDMLNPESNKLNRMRATIIILL